MQNYTIEIFQYRFRLNKQDANEDQGLHFYAKNFCKMKVNPRLPLFLLLLFIPPYLYSQQMSGLVLGNYSGVNGVISNPSSMHSARVWLDVQLAGMQLFVQNNAFYISKNDYRFSNFFKAGYEWPVHQEENLPEYRVLYRYDNARPKSGFMQARVLGPGAMLIWNRHAFAVSTGIRSVTSFRNVPYDVANFAYLGLGYWPQHNIRYEHNRPFNAASATWSEIGLSYAYKLYARGYDMVSAGLTVKRLWGYAGMYVASAALDYVVPDDSTLVVNNLDAEMGVAVPLSYSGNTVNTDPLVKGRGFGADIGFTYTRLNEYYQEQHYPSLCAPKYENYLYRIGVSLTDLGGIRFSENARRMNIDNRSSLWTDLHSIEFLSVDQLLDTISYQFYGDTVSAYSGDRFTMWLPAAVNITFDYNFGKNLFLNTNLIYGFPLHKSGIHRPAELTVTPRYETGWFEASLPVSLYNWQLPRIGLAVRVYGITIGTDKLGGFFHMNNFSGMDFYVAARFFLDKGVCRERGPVHCGDRTRYRQD